MKDDCWLQEDSWWSVFIATSMMQLWRESKHSVHIREDLTWPINTTYLARKAQKCIHFLWRTRRQNCPRSFSPSSTEDQQRISWLSYCFTVWYGKCYGGLWEQLRSSSGSFYQPLTSHKHCIHKAISIGDYLSHLSHRLFTLLPFGRKYQSIYTTTTRLYNMFFLEGVGLLNIHLDKTRSTLKQPSLQTWTFKLQNYLMDFITPERLRCYARTLFYYQSFTPCSSILLQFTNNCLN